MRREAKSGKGQVNQAAQGSIVKLRLGRRCNPVAAGMDPLNLFNAAKPYTELGRSLC